MLDIIFDYINSMKNFLTQDAFVKDLKPLNCKYYAVVEELGKRAITAHKLCADQKSAVLDSAMRPNINART